MRNAGGNVYARQNGLIGSFLGMILLLKRFPLPLTISFLRVCVPTLFADTLIFFKHYQPMYILAQTFPNKSIPTSFAAGKTFF